MNRLIISTDYKDLERILKYINKGKIDRNNFKGLEILGDEISTLYYDSNTDKFLAKVIDTRIVITKDSIRKNTKNEEPYDFSQLNISKETDCLLHHSQPARDNWDFIDNRLQGLHELHDTLYPPIFRIILDDRISPDQKADCIIRSHFLIIMKRTFNTNINDNKIPEDNKIPKYILEISGIQEQTNKLRLAIKSGKFNEIENIKNIIDELLFNGQ